MITPLGFGRITKEMAVCILDESIAALQDRQRAEVGQLSLGILESRPQPRDRIPPATLKSIGQEVVLVTAASKPQLDVVLAQASGEIQNLLAPQL